MDNSQPKSGPQHEESDLSIGGIVKAAVILVALGILTFVAAQLLMLGFEKASVTWLDEPMSASVQQAKADRVAEEQKAAASVMSAEPGAQPTPEEKRRIEEEMHVVATFPQPRLQYDDASDMKAMLAVEEKKLNSSGKDSQGNIYIPIDLAIKKVAEEGLPPVTGTFTPVNMSAPTTLLAPVPQIAGAGAKKK